MKKFKATYTPGEFSECGGSGEIDFKPRVVTVLEFVDAEDEFCLLFVDSDNTISVQPLDRFTDCEVWDN